MTLEQLWRKVRLRLIAHAEGPTQSFNSSVKGSKPESKILAGDKGSELDIIVLDKRWAGCRTDEDRKRVIQSGLEWWSWYSIKPSRTGIGDDDWKREIAKKQGDARTVAKMFNVSHTTVLKYRKDFAK